ncbi:unnamed protein product, partial [Cylicocyclus nassatus]
MLQFVTMVNAILWIGFLFLASMALVLIDMIFLDRIPFVRNIKISYGTASSSDPSKIYTSPVIINDLISISPDDKVVANYTSIPHFQFYEKIIAEKTGKRVPTGTVPQNFRLFAAYKFPEQITVTTASHGRYGDPVYCRYFDDELHEVAKPFKSVLFPKYSIFCLRRDEATFISLSESHSGNYTYPVPILDRTFDAPRYFFSVCLAPIYGPEPKWLLLSEFIEHYKIQGATHFYIYVREIDEYDTIVLNDYVRTGDAEVVHFRNAYIESIVDWHRMEIQDCLTRAKRHSQWVAFVDLDERLTPTNYSGILQDYLRNISDPLIGGIQFRQRWILKNDTMPLKYKDDNQTATYMPTLRYHNTSHVGPVGHTAKCIVDPLKVLMMEIHFPDKFYDNYTLYRLEPEVGVV